MTKPIKVKVWKVNEAFWKNHFGSHSEGQLWFNWKLMAMRRKKK